MDCIKIIYEILYIECTSYEIKNYKNYDFLLSFWMKLTKNEYLNASNQENQIHFNKIFSKNRQFCQIYSPSSQFVDQKRVKSM